ncbi:MAG: hypothetical protein HQ515_03010, partial [Phycisphaeraceae bacterium]|nr:hypothetical protein [Phycisphaeraceae bacterium]
ALDRFARETDAHLKSVNETTGTLPDSLKAALASNALIEEIKPRIKDAADSTKITTPAAPSPATSGAQASMEAVTEEKARLIRDKLGEARQFYVIAAANFAGLGKGENESITEAKAKVAAQVKFRDSAQETVDVKNTVYVQAKEDYEKILNARIHHPVAENKTIPSPSGEEDDLRKARATALVQMTEAKNELVKSQRELGTLQAALDKLRSDRESAEATALETLTSVMNTFLNNNVERRISAIDSFESAIGIIGTGSH